MKRKIKSWWLAVVSTVCWTGAVFAADIRYVADNGGGEYSGSAYGISVSVSAPASGVTIKYAESAMGPWLDELTYKDVCAARPICFQILAEGYTTVVDSRTVTITPKTLTSDFVWLVLPTDDYVYDGTAKTPDVACGDGDPSVITENDFTVSYSDNVNAGTVKATFTGKGNYTGTVEEEFEILKADNEWTTEPTIAGWTYGQAASEPSSAAKNGMATVTYGIAGNPGGLGTSRPTMPGSYVATFTVPESQNYKALSKDVPFTIAKATINYVADGSTGEYCGVGYGITVTVSTPSSGVMVKYSETDAGPWQDEPIMFKDVCTDKPIYFQIEAEGYKTVVGSCMVTITPRDIANVTVAPIDDVTFADAPVEPVPTVTDGNPSIVSTDDYTLSYEDNDVPGTAKLTLTGKNNYTGTKSTSFNILKNTPDKALLKAEVAWKLLRATGTYFAQLKVTCTNSLDAGLSDLRFVFADRLSDGDVYASLWDSRNRAAKSTLFSHNGDTYRYVALDAAQIQSENTETVFGVSNIASASIPVSERTIELYVRKRVDPSSGNEVAAGVDNFVGYVGWVSGGETNMIPVVSGAVNASVSRLMSASPMAAKRLNTALAVGVALDSGSDPYCRLVEFSVESDILKGKVEVGADTARGESVGAIGKNAVVVLLGAARLGDEFSEVCKIDVASDGSFKMTKPSKCNFFKLRIDVSTVVE